MPPLLLGLPGDNTFSNYAEANRAFWRQTVLPLVARVQKSFQAWLQPGFGPFRLDYNADRLEALASERAAEWERVGKAAFLTLDEPNRGSVECRIEDTISTLPKKSMVFIVAIPSEIT